jgi:hypothetical protein
MIPFLALESLVQRRCRHFRRSVSEAANRLVPECEVDFDEKACPKDQGKIALARVLITYSEVERAMGKTIKGLFKVEPAK